MVKSYLRYVPESPPLGLIASPDCNAVLHRNGLWAISPARQHIHVFHLQQGERLQALDGSISSGASSSSSCPPSVRRLLLHPVSGDVLCAGYSDGSVRLFSLSSSACLLTLRGHSSGISCLCFSSDGSQLFSGSQDTSICCWDIVAEKGRVRLRGHRDAVTGLVALERETAAHHHLISCGKDGQLRVWDLHSQHCLQTLQTGGELWALALDREERCLLTGGAQQSIAVWSIGDSSEQPQRQGSEGGQQQKKRRRTAEGEQEGEAEPADVSADVIVRRWGELRRRGVKRVISLSLSADGQLLVVHSADRLLELFAVRDEQHRETERKRRARRSRKRREKKRVEGGDGEAEPSASAASGLADDDDALQVDDAFSPLPALRVDRAKVLSVSCCVVQAARRQPSSSSRQQLSHRLLLSLADNSLALYGVQTTELRRAAAEPAAVAAAAAASSSSSVPFPLLQTVEQLGHRSPIRALSLSSDSRLLLTASSQELKLWTLASGRCIRTMECGAALCCLFVPGDRHAVVGTKAGDIEWFELSSAACLGKVAAHHGSSVFCMDGRADGSGFSTGGGDRTVRCWDYELRLPDARDGDGDGDGQQAQAQAQPRQLSIVLSRSLTLTDDVLCLRHSPDGRFLAVGLLDSTVRVFHLDSLRFSLALYGHRLPVIALDWSSDCQLIASASADKNVKLWGLAFGDCQCSLFAHADSATAVRWLRGTHHVVSAGKDGMVRVWDADARCLVQELAGHDGELWTLGTGGETGSELIVSAGSDRSIRQWRQSEQLLFLEEERERRLTEEAEEARALVSGQQPQLSIGAAEGAGSRLEVEGELVTGRISSDALTGGERLMEAIDIAVAERERRSSRQQQEETDRRAAAEQAAASSVRQPALAVNPFLHGLSPSAFVLTSLSAMPLPALDDCLLLLPFAQAVSLLSLLADAIEAGEAEAEVETCAACVLLLLQLHEPQIVSQRAALADLKRLRTGLRRRLRRVKGLLGRNRAAMRMLEQSRVHAALLDAA